MDKEEYLGTKLADLYGLIYKDGNHIEVIKTASNIAELHLEIANYKAKISTINGFLLSKEDAKLISHYRNEIDKLEKREGQLIKDFNMQQ